MTLHSLATIKRSPELTAPSQRIFITLRFCFMLDNETFAAAISSSASAKANICVFRIVNLLFRVGQLIQFYFIFTHTFTFVQYCRWTCLYYDRDIKNWFLFWFQWFCYSIGVTFDFPVQLQMQAVNAFSCVRWSLEPSSWALHRKMNWVLDLWGSW